MKKRIVVLGIIALIAVITSFSIASSFAKYKKEEELSDDARVAKWDIGVTKEIDLFSDSNPTGTVKSVNGDNVIAPGSSGEYRFKIVGSAETAYKITVEALEVKIPDALKNKLVFKFGECVFTDENSLNRCFRNTYRPTVVHAPNTPADANVTRPRVISWVWNDNGDTSDKSDTLLGNAAVTNKDNSSYNNQEKVILKIKVEAEQAVEE